MSSDKCSIGRLTEGIRQACVAVCVRVEAERKSESVGVLMGFQMPVRTETSHKAGGQRQVNMDVMTDCAFQVCQPRNELCDTCHTQHFTHVDTLLADTITQ